MRTEKTGFFSFVSKQNYNLSSTQSGYLEYGVSDKLTLGAAIDVDIQAGAALGGQGHIFLRRPLPWSRANSVWAYEIGFGAKVRETQQSQFAKTSLHFGKGVKLGKRNGWLAVDGAVEWHFGKEQHRAKIDVTLGVNISARSKAMVQIFTDISAGSATATLAPTYIFSPKDKKISYVAGFEAASNGRDSTALKIGVWHKF